MEEEDSTWPDEFAEMCDDDIPAKRPAARVKASKPRKASTHGRVLEEPVQDKAAKKARHTEAVQDDDEAEVTPPPKKKKHGACLQHTDAEEGESPPSEGKLTFAGRKQPAHGLPHMKWAVLRDAFRDHVRPFLHVRASRHEDRASRMELISMLLYSGTRESFHPTLPHSKPSQLTLLALYIVTPHIIPEMRSSWVQLLD